MEKIEFKCPGSRIVFQCPEIYRKKINFSWISFTMQTKRVSTGKLYRQSPWCLDVRQQLQDWKWVTVTVCANTTGTHKILLLLIDNSINPLKMWKFHWRTRAKKIYGWMPICSWNGLNTHFFPEIIKFQENKSVSVSVEHYLDK